MVKVLDASAVLAFIYAEPGHEMVKTLLDCSKISAVNWSETLQKIAHQGDDPTHRGILLEAAGLEVEPLTIEDAAVAAGLYPLTHSAGLSLGDRCCLALAKRLKVAAVTADKQWESLNIGIEIELIR